MVRPPGTEVARRCPGSGDAAGLVTRPRPNGYASTFSTTAAGSTRSDREQRWRPAARGPRRRSGPPRPPGRRVDGEHEGDRPGEELERGGRADREPGRRRDGRRPRSANASRQRARTGRSSPPVARVSAHSGSTVAAWTARTSGPAGAPARASRTRAATQRAGGGEREPHPRVGPPAGAGIERRGAGRRPPCPAGTACSRAAARRPAARRWPTGPGTACRSRAGGRRAVLDDEHLLLRPVGPPAGPLPRLQDQRYECGGDPGANAASPIRAAGRPSTRGRGQAGSRPTHGSAPRSRSEATAPHARCGARVDAVAVHQAKPRRQPVERSPGRARRRRSASARRARPVRRPRIARLLARRQSATGSRDLVSPGRPPP